MSLVYRMPWQGQQDNIIDRFDGRAHLDFIPPIQKDAAIEEAHPEERQANYERYRILAQNEFLVGGIVFTCILVNFNYSSIYIYLNKSKLILSRTSQRRNSFSNFI